MTRRLSVLALALAVVCVPAICTAQVLYVANYGSNDISVFRVGDDGGLITLSGPVRAGTSPYALAFHPNGHVLYACNVVSGDISIYAIDEAGVPIPVGAPVPVGPRPFSAATDAAGKFLYVTLEGSARIAGFRLESDGRIGAFIGYYATSEAPRALTRTREGILLVANMNGRTVGSYRVEANGNLRLIAEVPAGQAPFDLALSPSGEFLYVADFSGARVYAFAVGSDGTLHQVGAPLPTGPRATFAGVEPKSRYVYVGSDEGPVSVYAIGADGSLSASGPSSTPRYFLQPAAIAFDQNGTFAYVADRSAGDVVEATIGLNGALTPVRGFVAGATPISIATGLCTLAPSIRGLKADPDVLWPPNHQMIPVALSYELSSACGTVSCKIHVESNEDGSEDPHGPDWVVLDDHDLQLRAERSGGGEGRDYRITVHCRGPQDASVSASTSVFVPRSRGVMNLRSARPSPAIPVPARHTER